MNGVIVWGFEGNCNGKYGLLLRPHLYKVMCRSDCHIEKSKEGKYRSACAKHITKFTVAM